MFPDTPNRLEAVFVQRDANNIRYDQINISGSDLIIYLDSAGRINADKISVWAATYGLGSGGGSGSAVSASWASHSFTSTTASWARSASYAPSAPSISSSYTETASYAYNASTASLLIGSATVALSALWASSSYSASWITASNVNGAVTTSSYSISSSNAKTSSYSLTSDFSYTASYITASGIGGTVRSAYSASFASMSINAISASWATSSMSASYSVTSSTALSVNTASYALQALSASYIPFISASYSQTASYSFTASWTTSSVMALQNNHLYVGINQMIENFTDFFSFDDWSTVVTSTSTVTSASLKYPSRAGIIRLNKPTGSTGQASLYTNFKNIWINGGEKITWIADVQVDTASVSASTDNAYSLRMGFHSLNSGTGGNALMFFYAGSSTNAAKIFGRYEISGSIIQTTGENQGIPFQNETWTRLRMDIENNTASFYVGTASLGNINLSPPINEPLLETFRLFAVAGATNTINTNFLVDFRKLDYYVTR